MKTLSDIYAFVPKPIPVGTKLLSNAQIAQIMVRHEEILLNRTAMEACVKTLSAVRELRKSILVLIDDGSVEEGKKVLEQVKVHIGLLDEHLKDCEFD